MEPHVDLDQHVHFALGALHRVRPSARHGRVIDDEGEVGAIEQRDHAVSVDGIERIGNPDVVDAGLGEDFRLAELRAADADRAARDLQPGERRALVRLGVRPQPQAARRRDLLHALDVAFDARLLDEHARGPEIAQPHDGECISAQETGSGFSTTERPEIPEKRPNPRKKHRITQKN